MGNNSNRLYSECYSARINFNIIRLNQKIKVSFVVEEENKVLLKKIEENLSSKISLKLIDDYNVNGDFVEYKLLLSAARS